jgi:metal-dependent hydrolase (beta-lactamase superfamily II)
MSLTPPHLLQPLDRVEITVLMDNVTDSLSSVPDNVTQEWDMLRLGIPMGDIDAVVLSHGHWDHGGGLPKAFELIHAAAPGREPVP